MRLMSSAGPSASPSRTAHVAVFDGLRAIAIILVVWLHTWQLSWMPNEAHLGPLHLNWAFIPETGFVGVELFFFISGFCLFYPYVRQRLEGGSAQGWGAYFYRRAIKIVPSYWLSIALVLLLLKPHFFEQPGWPWLLGSHLLFVHNWSYDTTSALSGVLWSLGVEVQFYVLFPLIGWAFLRRPAWTYAAMSAVAIAWRLGVRAFDAHDYSLLLNQLPGCLDFFANGLLAAYLIVWLRKRFGEPGRWRWLYTLGALGALLAFGALLHGLYDTRLAPDWPWAWQAENHGYLGLTFLALGVCSANALPLWRAALANPVFTFLSTVSYNLYLYHQLIARELVNRRIPAPATLDPHGDPSWAAPYMALAIGLSLAWAVNVTYLIERPLLKMTPERLKGLFREPTAPSSHEEPEAV